MCLCFYFIYFTLLLIFLDLPLDYYYDGSRNQCLGWQGSASTDQLYIANGERQRSFTGCCTTNSCGRLYVPRCNTWEWHGCTGPVDWNGTHNQWACTSDLDTANIEKVNQCTNFTILLCLIPPKYAKKQTTTVTPKGFTVSWHRLEESTPFQIYIQFHPTPQLNWPTPPHSLYQLTEK